MWGYQSRVAQKRSGEGAGFAINKSQVQILAAALPSATPGKLFTHGPLLPSSIIWYQPIGGDARRLQRLPPAWQKVTAAHCRVYVFGHL